MIKLCLGDPFGATKNRLISGIYGITNDFARYRGMANPCRLTLETHRQICDLLRAGNYLETACAAAGVSARTARDWCRRGRNALHLLATQDEPISADDARFVAFAEDVEKAQGQGEARLVAAVARQATEDHRAAAFLLERKYPKRWGQKINVTVTEELNAFLDRLEQKLDGATFERVLEAALEHAADGERDRGEAT
jgi:transposase